MEKGNTIRVAGHEIDRDIYRLVRDHAGIDADINHCLDDHALRDIELGEICRQATIDGRDIRLPIIDTARETVGRFADDTDTGVAVVLHLLDYVRLAVHVDAYNAPMGNLLGDGQLGDSTERNVLAGVLGCLNDEPDPELPRAEDRADERGRWLLRYIGELAEFGKGTVEEIETFALAALRAKVRASHA